MRTRRRTWRRFPASVTSLTRINCPKFYCAGRDQDVLWVLWSQFISYLMSSHVCCVQGPLWNHVTFSAVGHEQTEKRLLTLKQVKLIGRLSETCFPLCESNLSDHKPAIAKIILCVCCENYSKVWTLLMMIPRGLFIQPRNFISLLQGHLHTNVPNFFFYQYLILSLGKLKSVFAQPSTRFKSIWISTARW